jgi:hypothetical protein
MTRANGTALDSEPWRLGWLGDVQTAAGNPERGLELIDEALALSIERGTRASESLVHWFRARALIALLGADAAEEIRKELDRADQMGDEIGYGLTAGWNRLERAELARLEGDEGSRQRLLHEAREVFERHGAHGWVNQTDDLLAAVAR